VNNPENLSETSLGMDEYARSAATLLQSFDDAQLAILTIQTVACDDENGHQEHARELLALLFDRTSPLPSDEKPDRRLYPQLCRLSDRINDSAERLRNQLTSARAPSHRLRWIASTAWASCALGAALLIANAAWWPALVLILMRSFGSILIGTSDFPADRLRASTDAETGRSRVERCLMSHTGDAVTLLGVAAVLLDNSRPIWTLFVAASACAMLLGSLARVGAIHTGVLIRRQATERIARRAVAFLSVLAVALFQPNVPSDGIPLIALCAIGPLAYALLELYNAHVRMGEGTGVTVFQRRLHEPPVLIHQWSAIGSTSSELASSQRGHEPGGGIRRNHSEWLS
jgi:hypothetical protein